MHRISTACAVLAGMLSAATALVAAAPAAFAVRIETPDGASATSTLPVTHHGMGTWELTAIALAAAMAFAAAATVVSRWAGRRFALNPLARQP
jgi:hypothetical protein